MRNEIRTQKTRGVSRSKVHAVLEREEELELARRWRDRKDEAARDQLVRSQLPFVLAIALGFGRHHSTLEDMVAEGNCGLIHALSKFDPERGNRLLTYSAYWIRSYINAHLRSSRSIVSTGVHSKLLSKLRREQAQVANCQVAWDEAEARVAQRLGVSLEKLRSLVERLDLRDFPIDAGPNVTHQALVATSLNPEDDAVAAEHEDQQREAVASALSVLSPRERYIVSRKLMADPEDALSLADIARDFGVSRERVRQLEGRAKGKLKTELDRRATIASDAGPPRRVSA